MVRPGGPLPVGTGRPRRCCSFPDGGAPGGPGRAQTPELAPMPRAEATALPATLLRWRACPLLVPSQLLFQTLPPASFLPEGTAVLGWAAQR